MAKLSPELIEELRDRAESGQNASYIARAMGLSIATVNRWARQHSIPLQLGILPPPGRLEQAQAWLAEHRSIVWIARQWDVSAQTVSKFLRKNGLEPTNLAHRGAARRAALQQRSVQPRPKPDLDARLDVILAGRAAGKTFDEIAAELRLTRNAVIGLAWSRRRKALLPIARRAVVAASLEAWLREHGAVLETGTGLGSRATLGGATLDVTAFAEHVVDLLGALEEPRARMRAQES